MKREQTENTGWVEKRRQYIIYRETENSSNLLRQEERANRKHRVGQKAKTIYYLQGNRKF